MDESDPLESNALESSLWEIHSLQSHYNPNVAVICKMISEQFTKPAFNLEDFLDHSYTSVSPELIGNGSAETQQMIEADLSKRMKQEPVVEFVIPKVVFPRGSSDAPEDSGGALGNWTFDR